MLKAMGYHKEKQIVAYVEEFAIFAAMSPFSLTNKQSTIAAVIITCALNTSSDSPLRKQLKRGTLIKGLKNPIPDDPLGWWY